MWGRSLGREDPLEKEMATHSNTLAWKIPVYRNSVEIENVYPLFWASQVAQVVKNLPANPGDTGLIPGLGRSPGEGNDNPLQYSCLRNPMDREAW